MSISDQITRLSNAKAAIKTSIENKGVTVGDDVKLDVYPALIDSIKAGGGSGETHVDPDFYEARTNNGTNYDHLFRDYNGPDIDVSEWDTSRVTSARNCFSYCAKSIDISNWSLSSLTNAYFMFHGCTETITGLENMDFSNVTNADNMFSYFTNGNKYIDLSASDFSNVTNADYMFSYSNTDYLDVRNINLTGATSYCGLFNGNYGTELDLSTWDISNVTNLNSMCSNAKYKKINLTGWKTTNVKNFDYTFDVYLNPLEVLLIPDWDMTNATSASSFIDSSRSKLKYIDLSRSNDFTIKKIASYLPTKTATTYGEVVVPANTSQDAIDALIARYWKPIGVYFDINSAEVALDFDEIKPGRTVKVWTGNYDPWYGDNRPEILEFISSDESIAAVNGDIITGITEGTVTITCRRREDSVVVGSATLTVSETDSKPNLVKFRTDGSESSSTTLITINGVSLTPSEIKKDVAGVYNYDPGEQITSINFSECVNEIVKFDFNAANIADMANMFKFGKTKSINITGWDTSNVTNMGRMLSYCYELVDIIGVLDLSNLSNGFDGTNSGDSIVNQCNNLETLYLKNIYKNCTMTNYHKWSISLGHTKVKDECLLYIINELPDLYAKGLTETDQIAFTLPSTNSLTAEQVQPAIDKGWTVVNCNF